MSIASEISRINNNIAAAYTACSEKGATMPQIQNSASLADTIDSIQQGSGGSGEKVVRFYDCDGTVLYNYSEAEALALTGLPALPQRSGLISRGWTWTLSEIKESVNNGDKADIGCYYAPTDGKTHLYVRLESYMADTNGDIEISFAFVQQYVGDVLVDWGDGTAEQSYSEEINTWNHRTNYKATHTYHPDSYPAYYEIKLRVIDGAREHNYGFGQSRGTGLFQNYENTRKAIYKIEIADGWTCEDYSFGNGFTVESITIPSQSSLTASSSLYNNCYKLLTAISRDFFGGGGGGMFKECRSLKAICSPKRSSGLTNMDGNFAENARLIVHVNNLKYAQSISSSAFSGCMSLEKIELSAVTSIAGHAFENCKKLKTVTGLSACTSIGGSAFKNCALLENIELPVVTSIGSDAFKGCESFIDFVLPSTVNTINEYAVYDCVNMRSVKIRSACSIGLYAFKCSNGNGFTHNDSYSSLEWVDLTELNAVPTLNNGYGLNSYFPLTNRYGKPVIFYVAAGMKSVFENTTNWTVGYYVEGNPPID